MPDRNTKAVTLIETVVVLAIMVILAAAAMIKIGTYQTLRLHMAARRIAADLRYAQEVAMSGNRDIIVQFTPAENKYWVKYSGYAEYILDPLTRENLIFDLDQDVFAGIRIAAVDFYDGVHSGYPRDRVYFGKVMGIPYQLLDPEANAWAIAQDGYVRIAYKDQEVTVCVSPETGEVSIRPEGESFNPQ